MIFHSLAADFIADADQTFLLLTIKKHGKINGKILEIKKQTLPHILVSAGSLRI